MKIAVYSAMHGRQGTVKKCLDYLHLIKNEVSEIVQLEFIYGYTWTKDGEFLKQWPEIKTFQAPNAPLWRKFDAGHELLKDGDYDACIMIGSDDIFDDKFISLIYLLLVDHDYIGFLDIFFHDLKSGCNYYWPGYKGYREGEPAGAGKVYSRKMLESLNYHVFQPSGDSGLDKGCHDRVMQTGLPYKFTKLYKWGAFLCDIKDDEGKTPLRKFNNLSDCGKELFSF